MSRVGNKCDETSTKFLGIHIDENLSWKRHICQLNSKIARASFAINQVKNVLPKESLKTLYVALIQPPTSTMEYLHGEMHPYLL